MVSTGFGMGPVKTLVGAFHVLRANQLWAPYPDNDPDGARASMCRFYALVAVDRGWTSTRCGPPSSRSSGGGCTGSTSTTPMFPRRALVTALVNLYSYVYAAPPDAMRDAARYRVEAMDLSDRWVRAGCRTEDPLLAAERRALVASHSALLDAVSRI